MISAPKWLLKKRWYRNQSTNRSFDLSHPLPEKLSTEKTHDELTEFQNTHAREWKFTGGGRVPNTSFGYKSLHLYLGWRDALLILCRMGANKIGAAVSNGMFCTFPRLVPDQP